MDPLATLKEILDGCRSLNEQDQGFPADDDWTRDELVGRLRALADWIESGGFAPNPQEIDLPPT